MSRQRMRQDQQFWQIVKDLRWKLEDGNSGFPPSEPEFGYGGGRPPAPMWATHIVAFLLGGIAFGLTLVAPAVMPLCVLVAVASFGLLHWRLHR